MAREALLLGGRDQHAVLTSAAAASWKKQEMPRIRAISAAGAGSPVARRRLLQA